MLNLFINHECNLGCDYCFVDPDPAGRPGRLSEADFLRLAEWLVETRTPALAILGGEPTLHPLLPDFLAELARARVGAVVFTNGLFEPELAEVLAGSCLNLVVNCNAPSLYRGGQRELFEGNLARLRALGARLTLSKNFSRLPLDYAHLLETASRHGIRRVRFDVARPAPGGGNRHLGLDLPGWRGGSSRASAGPEPPAPGPLGALAGFVGECRRLGIAAGLDCCLPLCYFTEDELEFLESAAVRFNGTCRPSLDVLSDLGVVHCQPLSDLRAPDVTRFAGEWDLLGHFAEAAAPLRLEARSGCGDCPAPESRCQGGCLAAARLGFGAAAAPPSAGRGRPAVRPGASARASAAP